MIVCVAVIEKSNDATVVYNGKQWTVIIEVILMGIVIVITSKENARLISLSFSFFLAAIAWRVVLRRALWPRSDHVT